MKGLLIRVAADQSAGGGNWNGPVDSRTDNFVYVPIPDDGPFHPGMATPYLSWHPYLAAPWGGLCPKLHHRDMHLDPDFSHLTYGDQGQRAKQIQSKLGSGDLLVFYSGLRDVHPNPRLIYAIIRSDNGKFFGFNESEVPTMDEMQGRFAGILSAKIADTATRDLAKAMLKIKGVKATPTIRPPRSRR